ncbi:MULTISPECIES: class I SAM-dependent methyltransferase [Methylobacterium]|uniref:class I SAM-dependent methyltransferase n=1 Tax=Methylobacterium TaxID=407 RepID=UPI0028B0225C|nr:methyltransferase domain-containing protein [Methylobacterium sp. DB0501]
MIISSSRRTTQRRVLNTGSGPFDRDKLHPAFRNHGWSEVRLDIDARVAPDLIGSVTDMRAFAPDASFDAVWSSHNVEHLHAHEVLPTFSEFTRILKPDGFALITCPDLQAVAQLVAEGKMDHVVYVSPAGPITPLDMMFGHSASIGAGNRFMAHNTGFTAERLGRVGLDAGFTEVRIGKGRFFDIWALALMPEADLASIAPLFHGTDQSDLLRWR